jgi:hypothetical protein
MKTQIGKNIRPQAAFSGSLSSRPGPSVVWRVRILLIDEHWLFTIHGGLQRIGCKCSFS